MILHLYVSSLGHRRLICLDPGGTRLPLNGAPWRHVGTVNFGSVKHRLSTQIQSAVTQSGMFVWPPYFELSK